MRTIHLTNAWHPASGGVRTFYQALLESADRHGHRVAVVVPSDAMSMTRIGHFGRLYTVRARPSPVLDRRYRTILPYQYLRDSSAIRTILTHERPDLIEVCDKYSLFHLAGLIKRRGGVRPTLVGLSQERLDDAIRAHVTDAPAGARWATWYLAAIYMRQFDAHLANSDYTAQELISAIDSRGPAKPKLWRLRERVHTLPLGVDVAAFNPERRCAERRAELLRQTGGTETSALVVFAGRLSREKHAHWVIPAVAAAADAGADVRLIVAGDGSLSHEMREQAAARLGPRVVFLGHIADRHALAAIIASADVFLHPNPHEPFGIGPLEAFAAGTPVVLPRSGGVLSYANDSNAWLAAPSSYGLGQALYLALACRDEAKRRAMAALATARALDWSIVTTRFFETYARIHEDRLARTATGDHGSYSDTRMPLSVSYR